MDKAWDLMVALASARGLHTLAWNMEHGVLDETCMYDRAKVRHQLQYGE